MDKRDVLLEKLEREAQWQWQWEKLNRYLHFGTSWATGICSLMAFALASYQMYLRDQPKYWITVVVAVCSAATLSLPILSHKRKWKQRQLVHDKKAREYDIILMKFRTDEIDFSQAVKLFEKAHKQSPETALQDSE